MSEFFPKARLMSSEIVVKKMSLPSATPKLLEDIDNDMNSYYSSNSSYLDGGYEDSNPELESSGDSLGRDSGKGSIISAASKTSKASKVSRARKGSHDRKKEAKKMPKFTEIPPPSPLLAKGASSNKNNI